MGFVFISHAAPDKLLRVKPLARALLHEGVNLYLDRPGVGDSHFGFDDAFIRRHGIRGLQVGKSWDDGLLDALRECDAVLLCLSRAALEPGRKVLGQEMIISRAHDNLVACIVDDLRAADLPSESGLLDLALTQCERVDPATLDAALEWLDRHPGQDVDDLPPDLRSAWEKVRSLRRALDAAADRRRRTRAQRDGPDTAMQAPPFMAPPRVPQWVARPDLVLALRNGLLAADAAQVVLLHGLPGAGKSELARDIANDARVQSHFTGGILWAELGQEPDLLQLLMAWVLKLDPKACLGGDVKQLSVSLATLLKDRAPCLLVLDDVWTAEHFEPFRVQWPHCRLLVTARREHAVENTLAQIVEVGPLPQEQAVELLRLRMGAYWQESLAAAGDKPQRVATLLGGLPAALELAAARVHSADDWDRLLAAIGGEVVRLDALESERSRLRGESRLEAMVHVSLRAVLADSRLAFDTFLRLGVLVEEAVFGAAVVARLMDTAEADPATILAYLRQDALLLAGPTAGTYRMHDVLRHLARRQLTRPVQPAREGDLPGLGMALADVHRQFIAALRHACTPLHALPPDGYSHEHLARHFEQAQVANELHGLLAEQTDAGRNGWYEAREQQGQTAGYLADVARAQALALASTTGADQDAGCACRYALMRASLRSLAGSIPPRLTARLVQLECWTVSQALTYIQQMGWTAQEETLAVLAPHLDTTNRKRLLRERFANAGEFDWRWTRRVAALAPTLGDGDRLKILRHAVDELLSGNHLYDVMADEALERLVGVGLPQIWTEELFDAVTAVRDNFRGHRLLAALADAIPQGRLEQALHDLPDAIDQLAPALAARGEKQARTAWRVVRAHADRHGADKSARVLEGMAPHLRGPLLARALALAARVKDVGTRLQVLAALIQSLARQGRAEEAQRWARKAMAPFAEHRERFQSWAVVTSALAPVLSVDEHAEVLNQLHHLADDEQCLCDLLLALAPYLPVTLVSVALERLAQIDGQWITERARGALLERLAQHLGWDHALKLITCLPDSSVLAGALATLAGNVPDALLDQYFELAMALPPDRYRAEAVDAIAPRLPQRLAVRALDLLRGVGDERALIDARVSLAPFLTAAQIASLVARADCELDAAKRRGWLQVLMPWVDPTAWRARLDQACAMPEGDERRHALNDLLDAAPNSQAVQDWLRSSGADDASGAALDAVTRLVELDDHASAWQLVKTMEENPPRGSQWEVRAVAMLAPTLPVTELGATARRLEVLLQRGYESAVAAAGAVALRLLGDQRQDEAVGLLDTARRFVDDLLAPKLDGSRLLTVPGMSTWPAALEALAACDARAFGDKALEMAQWLPHGTDRADAVVRVTNRLGLPVTDALIDALLALERLPLRRQLGVLAELLPVIATSLPASRCEQLASQAFERAERSDLIGDYVLAVMARRLAPWWSTHQVDAALAWCRSGRGSMRIHAIAALLRRVLHLKGADSVLQRLAEMSGDKDVGDILATFADVMPSEALPALVSFSIGIDPAAARASALGAVAHRLAALPDRDSAAALRQLIAASASWNRPELAQMLAKFAPALVRPGRNEAARELAAAIDDVGRWWP